MLPSPSILSDIERKTLEAPEKKRGEEGREGGGEGERRMKNGNAVLSRNS